MPIESIDIDSGLGHIWKAWGTLTGDDIIDLYEKHLAKNVHKQRAYRFNICDFSAVEQADIPTPSVRRIAERAKAAYAINPDGVVAIVAPHDVLFGLARMWLVQVGEPIWETDVFRNREDALAWLRERLKAKYGIEGLTFG